MASMAGWEKRSERVRSSDGSAKMERWWRDGRRVSMVIRKEASFLWEPGCQLFVKAR